MAKLALGIIETIGLAAAIEAADAAVKSANINLLGYELSKGGGMVTVKLEGYVGAVKAAVDAGCIAAEKVSKVWSKKVIPRPHLDLDKLIFTKETVGGIVDNYSGEYEEEELKEETKENEDIEDDVVPETVEDMDAEESSIIHKEFISEEELPEDENYEAKVIDINKEIAVNDDNGVIKKSTEICNLCEDPKCPRKKGEPRKRCINYENDKRRNSQ